MDLGFQIDFVDLLGKSILVLFIIFYARYTKIAFIYLLVDFETRIKFDTKKKYLFFVFSLIYTYIGSIFFFYVLLSVIGFLNIELLQKNINLFIIMNTFSLLYCCWKLSLYINIGNLSMFGEKTLAEIKKLKNIKL